MRDHYIGQPDKAFVLELASNQDDQIMVKTLIAMSKNLGLSTVAEGVEDQESIELLTKMGCSTAQGFYLSRPLPKEDITLWLEQADCDTDDDLNPETRLV